MSATVISMPRAAGKEDSWQAELGLAPFRERYPLWTRTPPSLARYLKAAQSEFPILGFCEVMQRHGMTKIEESCRELPDESEELVNAFVGLSRRHLKMGNALQGEALRFSLARLRVNYAGPITGDMLLHIMALVGVDP